MTKIFIDTNIFLDFYQTNTDPIKLLDEFVKNDSHIVLTDQAMFEFERNRVSRIDKLRNNFHQKKLSPFTVSILRNCDSFNNLMDLKKQINENEKKVIQWLDNLIVDPGKDIIFSCLTKVWNSEKSTNLFLNNELIQKAHSRKLIGNPPTSKDKYTIGDELHWEILLESMNEDLIILTRDRTFKNNIHILKKEFRERTGKDLLQVHDKFTDCLKTIDIKTSPEVEKIDKEIRAETNLLLPPGWEETGSHGERVSVSKGNMSGYTCRTPNIHFLCMNCGNHGPWNGTQCMSCGRMDDESY